MPLAEHLMVLRAWCKRRFFGPCKPDVLRPGILGIRGSKVIRLRPCMLTSTPPLTSPAARPPHPLPTCWPLLKQTSSLYFPPLLLANLLMLNTFPFFLLLPRAITGCASPTQTLTHISYLPCLRLVQQYYPSPFSRRPSQFLPLHVIPTTLHAVPGQTAQSHRR